MSKSHLSPASAAKLAQCGRTTIMRAIKDGTLRAVRDNEGRWRIDRDVLEDWSSMRQPDVGSAVVMSEIMTVDTTPDTPADMAMATSIARLEATVEGLRDALDQARADRDRWHALATSHRPNFLEKVRRSLFNQNR